jgi:hypothetical protein
MTQKTSFGRRGRIAKIPAAPASFEPAPCPEQRAFLFGEGEAPSVEKAASSGEIAPWSGRAAFAAGFSVTGFVVAFTLVGGPQEPVALAGSIFATGSNLAANLWLTQKFCAWVRLSSPWAFAATGAVLGVGVSFVTEQLGFGATELGYGMEAVSGAGAALLYHLLAGRKPASPFA